MRPDQLANVSYKRVQEAAMAVVSGLQTYDPATIVTGAAWVFLAICRRYDVDPRRALEVADRVQRHALNVAPQYPRAIEAYCREELPRD
jgi:hypothetical protein